MKHRVTAVPCLGLLLRGFAHACNGRDWVRLRHGMGRIVVVSRNDWDKAAADLASLAGTAGSIGAATADK